MKTTMVLLVITFTLSTVHCIDWVRQAKIRNHKEYYLDVMTEAIQALKEKGSLQISFQDLTQTLNETIYDWHIEGTVSYTNGFVVSIQNIDLDQEMEHKFLNNNETTGWIRGILNLRDVAVGFDVKPNLTEGQLFYTGVYLYKAFSFQCEIYVKYDDNHSSESSSESGSESDTNTPEITTKAEWHTTSKDRKARIKLLPSNNVGVVLARNYDPDNVDKSLNLWASEKLAPAMLEAAHKKPLPTICFSCS